MTFTHAYIHHRTRKRNTTHSFANYKTQHTLSSTHNIHSIQTNAPSINQTTKLGSSSWVFDVVCCVCVFFVFCVRWVHSFESRILFSKPVEDEPFVSPINLRNFAVRLSSPPNPVAALSCHAAEADFLRVVGAWAWGCSSVSGGRMPPLANTFVGIPCTTYKGIEPNDQSEGKDLTELCRRHKWLSF